MTLRPPDEDDLAAIVVALHDPDIVRWFGKWDASAMDILDLNRGRWAEGSPTFSICERDGACVGHVWVNVQAGDASIGVVGYWLLPSARGRGLATRAVRLISGRVFHELGITLLRLFAEPANERSQRVAERSGFRRIGIISRQSEVHGRSVDHVPFELTPDGEQGARPAG